MTKYYRLGGLNSKTVFSHSSGIEKSGVKVLEKLVPSEGYEGRSVPGLSSWPGVDRLLPVSPHHLPFVGTFIHVPSSFKDTDTTGLEPTHMISL